MEELHRRDLGRKNADRHTSTEAAGGTYLDTDDTVPPKLYTLYLFSLTLLIFCTHPVPKHVSVSDMHHSPLCPGPQMLRTTRTPAGSPTSLPPSHVCSKMCLSRPNTA